MFKSIVCRLIAASTVAMLVGCGSSSNSTVNQTIPPLAEELITLDFPAVSAFTHLDSVRVRGKLLDTVTGVEVNGETAQIDGNGDAWFVDLPLNAGDNELDIDLTFNGEAFTLDTTVELYRGTITPEYMEQGGVTDTFNNRHYFVDKTRESIWRIDLDGGTTQIVAQFESGALGNTAIKGIEAPVAFDAATETLYVAAYSDNDRMILLSHNTLSNQSDVVEIDAGAGLLNNAYSVQGLLFSPRSGSQGAVFIAASGDSDTVLSYDIASREITALDMPSLETITGDAGAGIEGLAYSRGVETDLLLWGERNNRFFTVIVDLSSCDGLTSCTLSYSDYRSAYTFADGDCDPERVSGNSYHPSTHTLLGTYRAFCSIDIQAMTSTNIYSSLLQYENDYSVIGDNLYFIDDDYNIASIPLPASYATDPTPMPTTEVSNMRAQVSQVALRNMREVDFSPTRQELIWIDEQASDIYRLNVSSNEWSVDDLGVDIGLLDEAEYDPVSNKLYFVNEDSDTDGGLYTWDPATNTTTRLFGIPDALDPNPQSLNEVESLALNTEEGLVYLAHHVPFDERISLSGMNLLAWDINNAELVEVAPETSNSDFNDFRASYDMSWDADSRRVLFYSSGNENPIIAINVDSGLRSIFSADNWYEDSISTSNARGQVLDASRQRLLVSSQNDESLFAIDLANGSRSYVSQALAELGPPMWSPKGIALVENKDVAFVSDERLELLYMIDLDSSQRLIVRH